MYEAVEIYIFQILNSEYASISTAHPDDAGR